MLMFFLFIILAASVIIYHGSIMAFTQPKQEGKNRPLARQKDTNPADDTDNLSGSLHILNPPCSSRHKNCLSGKC